jgi:hypothetical protein
MTVAGDTYREAARIYYRALGDELQRGSAIWMYAIQAGDDGPVKLGVSRNPQKRIETLQVANAAELRFLGVWQVLAPEEKQMHGEFADLRIRGEWFAPTPALLHAVSCYHDPFWVNEFDPTANDDIDDEGSA